MQLHDWLESAYDQGRISIAEALNVQRDRSPDWRVLIGERRFTYARASEVIDLTLDRRISLAAALKLIRESPKAKRRAVLKPANTQPPTKSKRRAALHPRAPREPSKFVQDVVNYLENAKDAQRRPPIEQISFFIESWETTYIRDGSLISGDRAEELSDLVRSARLKARTYDDYILVGRAERVIAEIRQRGLMPSNYKPRPISIPIGGQPKRRA